MKYPEGGPKKREAQGENRLFGSDRTVELGIDIVDKVEKERSHEN